MKSEEQEQINILIRNYLDGTQTQDDISALGKWVEASEENKKYYQQLKNIWEISAVAKADIHISAETAFDKVLGKITEKSNKKSLYFYFQRVAAVLLIPLILAGFLLGRYTENKAYNSSVIYNEVYAPAGTRSSLTLADGTRVWLNSGSKLRYPDKFVKGNRLVYLTGEAFFEVESDINKPFIVKTPSVSVRATGTRFNVEAYSSDAEIQVSLLRGKVSVHRNKGNGNLTLLGELKPNQMFSFDTISNNIHTVNGDIYKYIAWKDGRLVFRNEPLADVVKKISQIYNVDIELQGKELQNYRYRATFEEESLFEILKLLKLSSPIQYREVKREMMPNGTFTKRKIIIYPLKK